MADTSTTFSVDIEETGGDDAASSLEALRDKVNSGSAALKEMQSAMRNLKGGTSVNIAVFQALRDQITAQKAAIAAAQSSYSELGGTYESNAARAARMSEAEATAAAQAKAVAQAATEAASAARTAGIAAIESAQSFATMGEAQVAIQSGAAALQQMQSQMQILKSSASADVGAIDDLTSAIDRQKAEITGAQQAYVDLGGKASDALKLAGSSGEEAGGGLAAMAGPLERIGGRMAGVGRQGLALVKSLGQAGIAGVCVIAAIAAVALAAALIYATVKIAEFALSSSDAARTQSLLTAGIAKSVAGGVKLDDAIGKLGEKVPFTRDELTKMADDLAKTGLKGDALSAALEKSAIKAAQLKWGPDFAKQMLALDVQSERAKSNISSIFSGMDIEGVLKGLASVLGLLDQNTDSGKALHAAAKAMLDPLFASIAKLAPYAKAFFQGMIIGVLTLVLWFLKAKKALSDAFGSDSKSKIDWVKVAMYAGYVAVGLFVGVLVLLAAVMVIVAIAFIPIAIAAFLVVIGILLIVAAIAAVVYGFYEMYQAGKAVIDWLSSITLEDVGAALTTGLANGIKSAGAAVISAITGVVGDAISAAKSLLHINSPSKVFAKIGASTGEGMAGGIDASSDDVSSSASAMAAGAVGAGSAASRGGSSGGKPSGVGHVFNIAITVASDKADDIADAVKRAVVELLEEQSQMAGGEPETA